MPVTTTPTQSLQYYQQQNCALPMYSLPLQPFPFVGCWCAHAHCPCLQCVCDRERHRLHCVCVCVCESFCSTVMVERELCDDADAAVVVILFERKNRGTSWHTKHVSLAVSSRQTDTDTDTHIHIHTYTVNHHRQPFTFWAELPWHRTLCVGVFESNPVVVV